MGNREHYKKLGMQAELVSYLFPTIVNTTTIKHPKLHYKMSTLFSNEAEASDSISSDIRNEFIPESKPDEAAGPANPSSAGSSKLIENVNKLKLVYFVAKKTS